MSKSGGANVQKTTNNQNTSTNGWTGVDQVTGQRMGDIYGAAQRAGQTGPSSLVTGAAGYNTGMMGAGQQGLAALGGDRTALAGLMDPYQQQVIGATNAQWDQNDQHTMNAVNDRATAAGAFGGARHGLATGSALAQNNMNRNSAVSGLLSAGYGDAMNRAGMLAQGGFAGAGANANLGMGGVGNPDQWMMEMLKRGYMGPTGQNTSQQNGTSGAQTSFGANTSFKFGA